MKEIATKCTKAIPKAATGMERNSLRHVVEAAERAIGQSQGIFHYEYDFGDCWKHNILFEGCLRAEKGVRYPLCVEGERACPPEDVGGPSGYEEYLESLRDPEHEEWKETSDWRGPFRPEHFDGQAATKAMRRGLPNWRKLE